VTLEKRPVYGVGEELILSVNAHWRRMRVFKWHEPPLSTALATKIRVLEARGWQNTPQLVENGLGVSAAILGRELSTQSVLGFSRTYGCGLRQSRPISALAAIEEKHLRDCRHLRPQEHRPIRHQR
jgi:hypothetical protein